VYRCVRFRVSTLTASLLRTCTPGGMRIHLMGYVNIKRKYYFVINTNGRLCGLSGGQSS
jgi:hypothetical protein